MGRCSVCGKQALTISGHLGVCVDCIRERPEESLKITGRVHSDSRSRFGLPSEPPKDAGGLPCGVCANKCVIGKGGCGFCGLVRNINNRLIRYGGTAEKGILQWYYDDLPTNCVSWWICPGCTGRGYPEYACDPDAEYGHANLSVFYGACSFDCLFCQNWHYRSLTTSRKPVFTAEDLAAKVSERVSCICYFGGDPSSQMPHSLEATRIALENLVAEKKILRICWETNGSLTPEFAERAGEYALRSGGNMKFDLKTWSDYLNLALCGVSNRPTLENFRMIGEKFFHDRKELPVLSASTLLVPGYLDTYEVESIASFISQVDPNIPYTLLAFFPCYVMNDLSRTGQKQAMDCYRSAAKHLKNVRIGNVHLIVAP